MRPKAEWAIDSEVYLNLNTYLHPGVKGMQNRHLPPLLRFIPQFAQICIIFALSKFKANLFSRPVLTAEADRVLRQLVMYLTVFFLLMYKTKCMQLLSRVFCYS